MSEEAHRTGLSPAEICLARYFEIVLLSEQRRMINERLETLISPEDKDQVRALAASTFPKRDEPPLESKENGTDGKSQDSINESEAGHGSSQGCSPEEINKGVRSKARRRQQKRG